MSLSLSDHNEFHRLQGVVMSDRFTDSDWEEYVALSVIRNLEGKYPRRALAGEFDLGKSWFKKVAKVVRKVLKPIGKAIVGVLRYTPIGLVVTGAQKLMNVVSKKMTKKPKQVGDPPPPPIPEGVSADSVPTEYLTPDVPPQSMWVWENKAVPPVRWYQITGQPVMTEIQFAEFAKKWPDFAAAAAAATVAVLTPVPNPPTAAVRPAGVPEDAVAKAFLTPDVPPLGVWVWESATVAPGRWYEVAGQALMDETAFQAFAKKWIPQVTATPVVAPPPAPPPPPVDTATATVAAEAVVQGQALQNMGVQLPTSMQNAMQGAQNLLNQYGTEGNGLVRMAANDLTAAAAANDAPSEFDTAVELAANAAAAQIAAANPGTPTWVYVAGAGVALLGAIGITALVLRPSPAVMYGRRG